ncbi:MAG: dihydroorotase [Prevotella sp.]|nr:dihydroorotase [Prevotella sp.]
MLTLLHDADIVNEGRMFKGDLVILDDCIEGIYEHGDTPRLSYDASIDASGCVVMPGVIDTHVHFREPGLTHKADIESESRAAAWGGVTTFFDMPNTVPQTTSLEALADKFDRARRTSHVNYSFFFGATNDNIDLFPLLDKHKVPGIKLFMGSSTGNMLVDKVEALQRIFREATLPIVAHCEDTEEINRRMREAVEAYGDDPPVALHPKIRSAEACIMSTTLATKLARACGARLHVAHVSTRDELQLLDRWSEGEPPPLITGEAVVPHLVFTDKDYATRGALVKCNPAVKTAEDRDALRKALTTGGISTVATDHAPHRRDEKEGGCRKAASGMPMVQFSLIAMLRLVDEGCLGLPTLVSLMCHHPATLFDIHKRGYLRKGFKADVVVVRKGRPWTLSNADVQSKCQWTPLAGDVFAWRVEHVFCNGHHVVCHDRFDPESRGEEVRFRMTMP